MLFLERRAMYKAVQSMVVPMMCSEWLNLKTQESLYWLLIVGRGWGQQGKLLSTHQFSFKAIKVFWNQMEVKSCTMLWNTKHHWIVYFKMVGFYVMWLSPRLKTKGKKRKGLSDFQVLEKVLSPEGMSKVRWVGESSAQAMGEDREAPGQNSMEKVLLPDSQLLLQSPADASSTLCTTCKPPLGCESLQKPFLITSHFPEDHSSPEDLFCNFVVSLPQDFF